MPKVQFQSAYGPKRSPLVSLRGPSLTLQSPKDECDVNLILKKFRDTGDLSVLPSPRDGHYLDTTQLPDFFEGQTRLAEYSNYFSTLPSTVREYFGNDYRNMLKASVEDLAAHNVLGVVLPPPLPESVPIVTSSDNSDSSAG